MVYLAVVFYSLLIGFFSSLAIAAMGLLPAAIVIAVTEATGVRSAAIYGAAGALIAIGCLAIGVLAGNKLDFESALLFSVAALIGGFVYWGIAVKRAATDT